MTPTTGPTSSAPTRSQRPEIVYPDRDGKPMSDNTLQFKWIVTIKEGLEALYRDDPNVFVAGDLLWYPVEGDPKIRSAPDAMVVFGRPKGYRGSYRQWVEGGVAPQVVFEVASPGNRPREMARKLRFYERYGAEEYYLYDPDKGTLKGWLRRDHGFEPIERTNGFRSPRLGVVFENPGAPDALIIRAPDGAPFVTYVELFEEREALSEERNALFEERNALFEEREAERRRADAERDRADRLAAKLRELGLDADLDD